MRRTKRRKGHVHRSALEEGVLCDIRRGGCLLYNHVSFGVCAYVAEQAIFNWLTVTNHSEAGPIWCIHFFLMPKGYHEEMYGVKDKL